MYEVSCRAAGSASRGQTVSRHAGSTTLVSQCCAAAGALGSLACSTSMILVALGLVGSAVSAGSSLVDMPGMGSTGTTASQPGPLAGLLAFLVQAGPVIMIPSIAAMVLASGIRRQIAAIPALAAGAVMYWGMYLQPRLALMYAAIVAGFFGWAALYLWNRGWQFRP